MLGKGRYCSSPVHYRLDDLLKLLSTARSPLEMLLERDGRLRPATLALLNEPPAAE